MSRFAGAVAILLVASSAVSAQPPQSPEPPPTFEVVSIHPASDQESGSPFRQARLEGTRWTANRLTLRELVQHAYKLDGFGLADLVVGGEAWVDREQFNVIAVATTAPAPAQLAAMLQRMLAERFSLMVRKAPRDIQVFRLEPNNADRAPGRNIEPSITECQGAHSGSTVSRSLPSCGITMFFGPPGPHRLEGRRTTMNNLADKLSELVARPVIDRTAINGTFDFRVNYVPDDLPPAVLQRFAAGDAPSLYTALKEQLGLRLEPGREPVDVLVINRASRPTPN